MGIYLNNNDFTKLICQLRDLIATVKEDHETLEGIVITIGNQSYISHIASSDGLTTSFDITHTLGAIPSQVFVEAVSDDAGNYLSVVKAIDKITVKYEMAPPVGTDNIKLDIFLVK